MDTRESGSQSNALTPHTAVAFCPEQLYCPARLDHAEGPALHLVQAPDHRIAAVAFSSPQRLVESCGARATWIAIAAADLLAQIEATDEVEIVWLDPFGQLVDAPQAPGDATVEEPAGLPHE